MSNKDYLYLLRGKDKPTMQDMIDTPEMTDTTRQIMRAMREAIEASVSEFTNESNNHDVSDALRIQVESMIRQYSMDSNPEVRVDMNDDGTANVNVIYTPRVDYIDIDITV